MIASDTDSQTPYIYVGLGNGGFSQSSSLSGYAQAFGSAIADFDGDGVTDYVMANEANLRIYKGLGKTISARSHLSLATLRDADLAIESIDQALASILDERSKMAAFESRLQFVDDNLSSRRLILEDRNSADDTAENLLELTIAQIQQQAQMAALAQSFLMAQNILKLLPGLNS